MIKKKYIYFFLPLLFFSFGFYFLKNSHQKTKNFFQNSLHFQKNNFDQDKPFQDNTFINQYNNFFQENNHQDKELNKRSQIEAYFSPRDNIREIIIKYIELEKTEIICAAFRLTDQKITKALLDAHTKGIKITFIIDREGLSSLNSKLLHIVNSGIPVYFFPPLETISDNQNFIGLMHNKIMCFVGQRTILTGSFNFTKSAQDRNRENIIIIRNNSEIFNRYLSELAILKTESTLLKSHKINLARNKKNKFLDV